MQLINPPWGHLGPVEFVTSATGPLLSVVSRPLVISSSLPIRFFAILNFLTPDQSLRPRGNDLKK